jgi:hypothetical protein
MKKNLKTHVADNSNHTREEMQVAVNDLRSEFTVNAVARDVMTAYVRPLVSRRLYALLLGSLRGFEAKLQVDMAFYLFYYLHGESANYTGFIHVDGILDYLYTRCEEYIDKELTRKRRA